MSMHRNTLIEALTQVGKHLTAASGVFDTKSKLPSSENRHAINQAKESVQTHVSQLNGSNSVAEQLKDDWSAAMDNLSLFLAEHFTIPLNSELKLGTQHHGPSIGTSVLSSQYPLVVIDPEVRIFIEDTSEFSYCLTNKWGRTLIKFHSSRFGVHMRKQTEESQALWDASPNVSLKWNPTVLEIDGKPPTLMVKSEISNNITYSGFVDPEISLKPASDQFDYSDMTELSAFSELLNKAGIATSNLLSALEEETFMARQTADNDGTSAS